MRWLWLCTASTSLNAAFNCQPGFLQGIWVGVFCATFLISILLFVEREMWGNRR